MRDSDKRYVLGFAFHREHVYLLHKIRGPHSVRGKLNGLGGKIKWKSGFREARHVAMQREFREEGGANVEFGRWDHYCTLHGSWGKVMCFRVLLTERENAQMKVGDKSLTKERVGLYDPLELPMDVVPNLRWLIPMAMDRQVVSVPSIHLNIPGSTIVGGEGRR